MGANDKLAATFHEGVTRPSRNDSTHPGAAYHPRIDGDRRQKVVKLAAVDAAEIHRPYVPSVDHYLLVGANQRQAQAWAREYGLEGLFRAGTVITTSSPDRLRGMPGPVAIIIRDVDFRPFVTEYKPMDLDMIQHANFLNSAEGNRQFVMPIHMVLTEIASGGQQYARRLWEAQR